MAIEHLKKWPPKIKYQDLLKYVRQLNLQFPTTTILQKLVDTIRFIR